MDPHPFNNITLGHVLSILTFVVTIVLGVWKISGDIKKGNKEVEDKSKAQLDAIEKKFTDSFEKHCKEEEEKRGVMYRRMDEMKAMAETKFMSRELGSLLHEGTAKSISGLESKFEVMRGEMKSDMNGIAKSLLETRESIIKLTASNLKG